MASTKPAKIKQAKIIFGLGGIIIVLAGSGMMGLAWIQYFAKIGNFFIGVGGAVLFSIGTLILDWVLI